MIQLNPHIREVEMNSTYPGEYRLPPYDWNELIREIENRENPGHPLTNMSECNDYYKIEITAPGHKREDFIAMVSNHTLTLLVLSNESSLAENAYQQHEFDYSSFAHSVDLPHDADPDFAKAEYRMGVVNFYFPKVLEPVAHAVQRLVVY